MGEGRGESRGPYSRARGIGWNHQPGPQKFGGIPVAWVNVGERGITAPRGLFLRIFEMKSTEILLALVDVGGRGIRFAGSPPVQEF